MSSDKHCCVPGCKERGVTHKVLHGFPNPEKDRARFNTWLYAIGGDIIDLENRHIYKYRRVCRSHFQDKYLCRNHKISHSAVPTLNMPEPLRLQKSSNRKPMQEICDGNKASTSFDPVALNLVEALPLHTSHTKTQQNLVMAKQNACGGDRFPEAPRRPGVLLLSEDFDEIVQYKGSSRWYTRAGHFYVASRSRGASTTMRCSTDRCPAHWILRDGKAGPNKGLHNHPPTPWVLNRNIMFQALKRRASEENIPLSTIYEEEAARYPDAASHLLYESVLPSMRKWRRNSQLGVFPPLENTLVSIKKNL